MLEYSEKRDFIRMNMACDMQLQHQGQTETVRLLDLSASGMSFVCHSQLSAGERLQVTITPERDITPPMQAEIEILRCNAEGDQFSVAATIQQILPAQYAEAEAG